MLAHCNTYGGRVFAGERETLARRLGSSRSFQFLRLRPVEGERGPVDEFLYRQAHAAGETFWTMRFAEGLLVSLNWEEE